MKGKGGVKECVVFVAGTNRPNIIRDLCADQSVARTENEKILATNASSEAPLERQKMIILFMKIRLLSLQSRAICN